MTTVCGKCHDREGTWYMKPLRGNKPIWGGPYVLPGTWRKGGGLSTHFCLKTPSLGFSDNTLLRFPYFYDWSFPVPPPVPTGKCWPSQGFHSIFSLDGPLHSHDCKRHLSAGDCHMHTLRWASGSYTHSLSFTCTSQCHPQIPMPKCELSFFPPTCSSHRLLLLRKDDQNPPSCLSQKLVSHS